MMVNPEEVEAQIVMLTDRAGTQENIPEEVEVVVHIIKAIIEGVMVGLVL